MKINQIHKLLDSGAKSATEVEIIVDPTSARFIGNEAETISALKLIFQAFIDLGFGINSAEDNVHSSDRAHDNISAPKKTCNHSS